MYFPRDKALTRAKFERIKLQWDGRVGGCPLKESVVNEITIKLQLPLYEGKSHSIFQFRFLPDSLRWPHRDFRDDSFQFKISSFNKCVKLNLYLIYTKHKYVNEVICTG